MKVVKYYLGTYTHRNQRFPLCLYHFVQQDSPGERTFTFHLKLRDLDQIFCETAAGYVYNTKILDLCKDSNSNSILTEESGEIYVEAHVVEEIARQIGEKVLIELCQLDESAIRSDAIKNVLNPLPNVNLEDEIAIVDIDMHVVVGLNRGQVEVHVKTEDLVDSGGFHIPRLSKSPQLDKTIRRVRSLNRMAIEEVLDRRSVIFERPSAGGAPPHTMEAISEDYSHHLVSHRFPHESDHSSSHSPPSNATTPTRMLDDESVERKRKRPITPLSNVAIAARNIHMTTSTVEGNGGSQHVVEDVTEHIRALHKQQKQQHIAQSRMSMLDSHSGQHYLHHSRPNANQSIPSKVAGLARGKNTRNLTISTPSYEESTGAPKSAPIHPTYQHLGGSSLRLYPTQGGQVYSTLSGQRLVPPNSTLPPNTAIPYEASRYGRGSSSYHPSSYMGSTPTVKSNAPLSDPSVNVPQPSVPPRPVTAHPYSSQAVHYSSKPYTQHPSPPKFMSQLSTPTSGIFGSKQQFMSLFESLFDNVDSARGLKVQLEDQIRKSTTLLQTLQASGPMIEGLVRSHFRDMQGQFIEKYDTAIEDIVQRLDRVEERQIQLDQQCSKALNHSAPSESGEDPDSRLQRSNGELQDPSELPTPPLILSHPRLDREGHLTRVVKSQGVNADMKTRDYEEMIKCLVDRLETLERRIDQH